MLLSIDVIVRTKADRRRSRSLFRALDSIQDQGSVAARPIVVVNGQEFDGATLAALKARPCILLHQMSEASAGRAIAEGHRLVTAPYFSFLDDDDTLIAHSLAEPMKWLENHPCHDVLISNGYFVREGGVRSELIHIADHLRTGHPALSLLEDSWLQPGAFIVRTNCVSQDVMDTKWTHMEWTRLAFELCAGHKRLHFMDVPTVLYFDTPGSLSKQLKHLEAELDLLRSIRRDARLDAKVRQSAGRKYLRALHNLAMRYWERGQYGRAWRCHMQSLRPPNTLRYLLFSRRLLWPVKILAEPRPGTQPGDA